jgi:hypothetical protein
MSANNKPSTQEFRQMLARGEIPLDDRTLPIEVNRSTILEVLAHHLKGTPRKWKVENHSWNRDELLIDILWYPRQSVFLTFQNGILSLIEFSGSGKSDSKWDYSLEVRRYFQLKKEAVKHLGKQDRSNESNDENIEVIWEFPKLIFYIACDAKTGGCGIGLRAKMEDDA